MTHGPTFQLLDPEPSDGVAALQVLGAALIADALGWRAGLSVGDHGPTVGADGAADITYEPWELVALVPFLVDDALLQHDGLADDDGADECDAQPPDDVPAPVEPWGWLRTAAAGVDTSADGLRVVQVLDPAYDRSDALGSLDEVVAAIFRFWSSQCDGCLRIAGWARDRETERRATARRLEGLRRRYDRDLLAMADQVAAIGRNK